MPSPPPTSMACLDMREEGVNKVYTPGGIAGQPPGLPDVYLFCGSPQQRAERPCPAFPSHSAALPDCMMGTGHSGDRAGHQAPTEMHLG